MTVAAPSETLLSVQSLVVAFERLVAVRDVNMSLPGGCLLGLIGPNGAGKTTLLRAIAGLQPITRGLVTVLGERVTPGNVEALRHIGFTPDTPPVYEDLSVTQFLTVIGKGYQLTAAEISERIDFWLEKVWLTEKAKVKVKELSRGMRQRLGIARTLLPNPSMILLDEPAAGLDPAGRVQFRQLLMSLREQGKTLIVSSHILADMSEYCTHIAIMSAGEVIRFGTVQEVADEGAGVAGRCRYTILLARPMNGIEQPLAQIEGVRSVDIDGTRIVLEYFSDRDRAAALLAQLIAMHIPVASFAPNAAGLEEAYLRTGIVQVD